MRNSSVISLRNKKWICLKQYHFKNNFPIFIFQTRGLDSFPLPLMTSLLPCWQTPNVATTVLYSSVLFRYLRIICFSFVIIIM